MTTPNVAIISMISLIVFFQLSLQAAQSFSSHQCSTNATNTTCKIQSNTTKINCSETSECCTCESIQCGTINETCKSIQFGESAAFGVQNIYIISDKTDAINVNCLGEAACAYTNIDAFEISGITCESPNACYQASVNIYNPPTVFTIHCNDTEACAYSLFNISINNTQTREINFQCDVLNACSNAKIQVNNKDKYMVVNVHVHCINHTSCKGIELVGSSKVLFYKSCAKAMSCVDGCIYDSIKCDDKFSLTFPLIITILQYVVIGTVIYILFYCKFMGIDRPYRLTILQKIIITSYMVGSVLNIITDSYIIYEFYTLYNAYQEITFMIIHLIVTRMFITSIICCHTNGKKEQTKKDICIKFIASVLNVYMIWYCYKVLTTLKSEPEIEDDEDTPLWLQITIIDSILKSTIFLMIESIFEMKNYHQLDIFTQLLLIATVLNGAVSLGFKYTYNDGELISSIPGESKGSYRGRVVIAICIRLIQVMNRLVLMVGIGVTVNLTATLIIYYSLYIVHFIRVFRNTKAIIYKTIYEKFPDVQKIPFELDVMIGMTACMNAFWCVLGSKLTETSFIWKASRELTNILLLKIICRYGAQKHSHVFWMAFIIQLLDWIALYVKSSYAYIIYKQHQHITPINNSNTSNHSNNSNNNIEDKCRIVSDDGKEEELPNDPYDIDDGLVVIDKSIYNQPQSDSVHNTEAVAGRTHTL